MMKATMKAKSTIRCIAIVALIIMMLATLACTAWYTMNNPMTASSYKAKATTQVEDTRTEIIQIQTDDSNVVGLIDRSGSMSGWGVAVPFVDQMIDINGSEILGTIKNQLDSGITRLVVVTDCESYPVEDLDVLKGCHYENVEILFYVPNHADPADQAAYEKIFSQVSNKDNCTIAFFHENGQKDYLFDNYVPAGFDNSGVKTDVQKTQKDVSVEVEATVEPYIPVNVFLWVIETIFCIICVFLIALIALSGDVIVINDQKDDGDEPKGIGEAVKADVVLLDGSTSVSNEYRAMLEYCESNNVKHVNRFTDNVVRMTVAEAKNTMPDGNTYGWKALREAIESGAKTVTIVSDFMFNDPGDTDCAKVMEHKGELDKVFIVHNGCADTTVIDQIKSLAKNAKEIDLK